MSNIRDNPHYYPDAPDGVNYDDPQGELLALQVDATLALAYEQRRATDAKEATNTLLAGILVTIAGGATDGDIKAWAADAANEVHDRLASNNLWKHLDSAEDARQRQA